jgi:hypothetical protein
VPPVAAQSFFWSPCLICTTSWFKLSAASIIFTSSKYVWPKRPEKVAFFAPSPGSNAVAPWGDQLGSMNQDHASLHHPAFAAYVSEIAVDCVTFKDLEVKYKIESIGTLFTDTEGFDSIILPTFPFRRVVPDNIVFEYKHSDGVFNIGRKFGMLICLLDKLGYNIRVVDMENCVASRRK